MTLSTLYRNQKHWLWLIVMICFFSCKKEETIINLPLVGPAQEFYALSDNSLIKFNAKSVKTSISKIAISGIAATEKILSIDFRPSTGELYGVSDANKIYIINIASGTTRAVSTTAFTPALNGTVISLNFDPTTDRIRVVTNANQNLSINPETGVATAATNITGGTISGAAFSNSYAGASTTILYDIDATAKALYKQDSDNGTLTKIGDLGMDIGSSVTLDISPDNKNSLAIGTVSTGVQLYTIDLTSGKATLCGKFPANTKIRGIAIPTNPAAYAVNFDAVNNVNNLLFFNPLINDAALSKTITGLQTGETILGLDMRPLNGQLYALGSTNRLYTINMGSGAATSVGTLTTALNGTSFGFDFNPVTDLIRVVSNTGQNLRVDPKTAVVTADPNITLVGATISAAAFGSNIAGSTTTKLYVIDHTSDKLYTQEPNTGVLTAIDDLKVDIDAANGFDIISNGFGDTAYGLFTVAGVTKVYTVNLTTGAASPLSTFNKTVSGFTLGLRY